MDYAKAAREMDARREAIRAVDHKAWPYAYDKPISEGGRCLECGANDGSHHAWCEAIS